MGALALPEPARGAAVAEPAASPSRPRVWSSRRCGWPACSTTSATGRSPTSSTTTSWPAFDGAGRPTPARRQAPHPRGPQRSGSSSDELGPLLRGLRRAPGAVAERDAFARRRGDRPGLGRLPHREAGPRRPGDAALGPLARSRSCRACSRSTTSTTSGATPTSPASRSGRSTSSGCGATRSSRTDGLTLFEPGLRALEMFLTARRFMYQQVYFHRTVRAIDLDLAEVFGPSVRAIFGDGLAGRPAGRPTPTSTSTPCSTRRPAGRAARMSR